MSLAANSLAATAQPRPIAHTAREARAAAAAPQEHARRITDTLKLLEQQLPIQRRMVRAGDTVYQAGERFACLYIVHSGFFKLVNLAADGREQVVALHFKGDWLGFDGIAGAQYGCDAVAMDIGEVWAIRYDSLLRCCTQNAEVMGALHTAMCHEMARDRDSLMSLCTLPADARVAEFLRYWVDALACRGLRTDQITLRMTRAEIGSYLGMTLESVSRALSRLEREQVVRFAEKGRREMQIPDAQALSTFVQRSLAPASTTLQ
jgi:CRP/FNR family transcriptional regulator